MFKRQWLFGGYILDFYCSELKLAIEIDGKVHGRKTEKDEMRDHFLKSEGVMVLRIPARRVLRNGFAVAHYVKEVCQRLDKGVFDPDERSNVWLPNGNASLDREAGEGRARGTKFPKVE